MNRNLAWALLLVASTACAQGALAEIQHRDSWVWIIGGFGAAVVYVKNKPASKADALINSMISVLIGGLVSPYVATYLGDHYDKSLSSPYPLAFLLSAFWPWVIPFVIRRARLVLTGQTEDKQAQERERDADAFEALRKHHEGKDEREGQA